MPGLVRHWKAVVIVGALVAWIVLSGAARRLMLGVTAVVVVNVIALVIVSAVTSPGSTRRVWLVSACQLLTLAVGVCLCLGAPVSGYRDVGGAIVVGAVAAYLEGPGKWFEQRFIMPVWRRLKPALVWMFGEWDEQDALSRGLPDDAARIRSPEPTDSP